MIFQVCSSDFLESKKKIKHLQDSSNFLLFQFQCFFPVCFPRSPDGTGQGVGASGPRKKPKLSWSVGRLRARKLEETYESKHGWKWMFPKIVVPPIINSNRVFHYKPSILGHPCFWKHPNHWRSTSWWLNQPIWKICSANWIISPGNCKNKNIWNHHLEPNIGIYEYD